MFQRLLGVLAAAAVLISPQSPSAQDLFNVSCNEVRATFNDQMDSYRRQASQCHDQFYSECSLTGWKASACRQTAMYSVHAGSCWGSVAAQCADGLYRCQAAQTKRDSLLEQCRRQEVSEATRQGIRRLNQGSRQTSASSLSSVAGRRSMLEDLRSEVLRSNQKTVARQAKGFALKEAGAELAKDHPRLGDLWLRFPAAMKLGASLTVAKALAKSLSGASNEERIQGTNEYLNQLLGAGTTPVSRVISRQSFLVLRSMQLAVLNDLDDVAANIALLKITDVMKQAHGNILYEAARIRWSRSLQEDANRMASRHLDMSTADLVTEFQAKARQIAHAHARALEARERAAREQADRVLAAQEEAMRQNRLAADRAEREAAYQQLLRQQQWQQWEANQQRAQEQQFLNSFMRGVASGLSAMPRANPAPQRGYSSQRPPAAPPSSGGCAQTGPGSACR